MHEDRCGTAAVYSGRVPTQLPRASRVRYLIMEGKIKRRRRRRPFTAYACTPQWLNNGFLRPPAFPWSPWGAITPLERAVLRKFDTNGNVLVSAGSMSYLYLISRWFRSVGFVRRRLLFVHFCLFLKTLFRTLKPARKSRPVTLTDEKSDAETDLWGSRVSIRSTVLYLYIRPTRTFLKFE